MRIVFSLILSFFVVATGIWAYWQNHKTSSAKAELAKLERRLGNIEQDIVVYQIEWSNLNRPARLRALVGEYFDALGLIEITARSYAHVTTLAPLRPADAPLIIEDAEMVKIPGEKP